MAKINILPAKVYNRIAAGEVVDRPYSVVKELVENSIDAGATEIEIHIEAGGKNLIRVIDNGHGIEREDLHSAFLPHATSKISKADDLENILTLGFRGEAIASIASVSKMTIISKTETGKCYSLRSEGGAIGEIKECAGENGTDAQVENLFFNTPVRKKFLKSDKAEETDITNVVSRFILGKPNVSFTYYANGKKVLQSFGGGDEEAIVGVYGASIVNNCYRIDTEKNGISIRGYIGNQNFYKANKTYQSMFLNGRYIINSTLAAAISNAYNNYLMKRQYPFYVLHINVPPEIVDVNVHPNKADVRFADNQIIYGTIYSIIRDILDGSAKALDYIVDAPQIRQAEQTSAAQASIPAKFIDIEPASEAEALLRPDSVDKNGRAQPKIEPIIKPNTAQSFAGVGAFTYEDAKRELETNAPAFMQSKKSEKAKMQLPFDVEKELAEDKGFIPAKDIPDMKPLPVRYGEEIPKTKRVKGEKTLRQQFPDLYFERNVIIVNEDTVSPQDVDGNMPYAKEIDVFEENKKYLHGLEEKAKQNKIDVSTCKYAGKLFNTYLLYEKNDEVYIIDQHAAHERLIYDRLRAQMQMRSVPQQPMLLPFELRLNVFESTFIRERMEDIRAMGFDIQEDVETVFKVYAVPVDLQKINLSSFFNDILGDVSGYRSIKLADLLKDKLATAACKAAVKGGMDLTQEEIDKLFAMMDGDMGLKCPHGRPVVVKMTKTQLEKMFKRIV